MSQLRIRTELLNNRTVVADSFFTTPLKIGQPFYHEDGFTEVMVLMAGPGMLKGDHYEMAYEAAHGTKTLITSQSYQKLYNSGNGETAQNISIKVGSEASLAYVPHPVIPFMKNTFHSQMEVELAPTSQFFFSDILATGRRIGMEESFQFAKYSSRILVKVEGRPVFLDHTRMYTDEADFSQLGFYEGRGCQGLIYLYNYENLVLPETEEVEAAISKAREGHVVRILGDSSDAVYRFVTTFWNQINQDSPIFGDAKLYA